MPFIDSKITVKVPDEKREAIKTELGQAVSILSKPESFLMVGFDDEYCLYMGGDRLEKGAEAQVKIFGAHMKEAWKAGHINRWLAANCFGDYYTRGGLDLRQRELITFCFLAAQGGCEPQLTAHAKGNINLGNDKDFLMKVVSQCLPYIGYPRSLNAVNCINKAAES